jgi:hypothetical protein
VRADIDNDLLLLLRGRQMAAVVRWSVVSRMTDGQQEQESSVAIMMGWIWKPSAMDDCFALAPLPTF